MLFSGFEILEEINLRKSGRKSNKIYLDTLILGVPMGYRKTASLVEGLEQTRRSVFSARWLPGQEAALRIKPGAVVPFRRVQMVGEHVLLVLNVGF